MNSSAAYLRSAFKHRNPRRPRRTAAQPTVLPSRYVIRILLSPLATVACTQLTSWHPSVPRLTHFHSASFCTCTIYSSHNAALQGYTVQHPAVGHCPTSHNSLTSYCRNSHALLDGGPCWLGARVYRRISSAESNVGKICFGSDLEGLKPFAVSEEFTAFSCLYPVSRR